MWDFVKSLGIVEVGHIYTIPTVNNIRPLFQAEQNIGLAWSTSNKAMLLLSDKSIGSQGKWKFKNGQKSFVLVLMYIYTLGKII